MANANQQRGAVYVELLIVLLPVVLFVLALVQTALMYAGKVVVQRAANTAARAAVVILDDDPRHYGGAPRNTVSPFASRATDPLSHFVAWMGLPPAASFATGDSPRLQDIRAAASLPLLSVSPSLASLIGSTSVNRAIGAGDTEALGGAAALYTRGAVAVNFPTSPGATSFRQNFDNNAPVTTRVTYLFHCGVPLVRHLMCESIPSIRAGVSLEAVSDLADVVARPGASASDIAEAVRRIRIRSERIERWNADELAAAEAPWLVDLTALTGARYFVMRAEATLPNQGADYAYAGAP